MGAMHPCPIAELSMPQVCDEAMQQPVSPEKPGIGMLGAGHIAFSGGGVHSPALPTQPQPPLAKQHGVASAAFGMNILSVGRMATAGLEQVIAPHITDVAPAPEPAALPVAGGVAVAPAPVVPTFGCGSSVAAGSLAQPAMNMAPAIAANQPLVLFVFIAARLYLGARRMRNAALAQDPRTMYSPSAHIRAVKL
jgi:hypothetical protein